MAENDVEFGVLGPPQICVDGAPVPLGTPKQRAVLVMLLINRNRPVGIDSLIDAAWEQFPPRIRAPACIPTCPTSASCSAALASTPARHWSVRRRGTG